MKTSKKIMQLTIDRGYDVMRKVHALESKDVDVVHLEIGEPDFDTPKNICDAAIEAIRKGYTHYCDRQGLIALRTEIAKEIEKTRGVAVDPERIVVAPGCKSLIFYSILALLEEGDEAIYPNPGFPEYESVINFTGATPVPIQLREELSFRIDIDELKSKITTRTKLIIINSPHNPTGAVLEKDDIHAIADLAQNQNIFVLSDEVYDRIIYEGEPYSIISLNGMFDRTILLNSFSKIYAMTGWRLGYGVMPSELLGPVMHLIANSVSCTSTFIQYAGIEALTGSHDSISRMVDEFKERRDLMVENLNEISGVSCVRPKGAFYVFPNVKKIGMDSTRLADYLLKEYSVATLPGISFGKFGEGYLRLSYAASLENIETALKRIKKAVAQLAL